ncbi:MAG: hypothetical protein A2297_00420 [Elusimicrobia bacterium RIFOXYB2_FULL_48_7]|nr:MAG: hypothetical protein A2297_00420 [Elusimicrobia bacterium RIFOXYB2_FULL_48_7]
MKKLLTAVIFAAISFVNAYPAETSLDHILKQAGLRQEKIEKGVVDMNFTANTAFLQKNTEGKTEKKINSSRVVYQKQPDILIEKYSSMEIDGKALTANELDKETKKRQKRTDRRQSKSPFSPSMKDSYAHALSGETEFEGRSAWVVSFTPKEKKETFIEGKAYISKKDFSVLGMDFVPAVLPPVIKAMKMSMSMAPVDGYWLPAKFRMEITLKITFIFTLADKRIEIEETYSDYKLNTPKNQ